MLPECWTNIDFCMPFMQVFFKALFKNPGPQDKVYALLLRILARTDNASTLFSYRAPITGKVVCIIAQYGFN